MSKELKIRAVIVEAFPKAQICYVTEKTAEFEIDHGSVTFDALTRIAEGLGTKLIDIGVGSIERGCDTCGYGESKTVEIKIRGISL